MKRGVKIVSVLAVLMIRAIINLQAQAPCPCKIPVDNTFQIAPMTLGPDVGVPPLYENYNAATPAIALPFHFCFYGQIFDSVYIGNKGIVTFKKPIFQFDTSGLFPFGADSQMIAPFYSDNFTLYNGGVVYYKITPTYMVVVWDSVRYAGTDVDGWNTYQLIMTNGSDPILPTGSNVSFCYPIMQWACSDSAGGFSGYGGSPATVGVNKGNGVGYAQITTSYMGGTSYYGPFSPYNGVEWLDFQSFTLNTCATASNNTNIIAPVICNYTAANSTFYICPCDTTATETALGAHDSSLIRPCDTVSFTGAFLCAVPGQTAKLSYSCEGPLNVYSVDTSTVNYIDSITVTVIPAFGDTGRQVLTLIASNPVTHLESSITYTIVVTVNCQDSTTILGISEPEPDNGFSIYPNPASKKFTIRVYDHTGITTAGLYNVLGNKVISANLLVDASDIDISGLAKGMYFVRLFIDGVPVSVKKLIIQ